MGAPTTLLGQVAELCAFDKILASSNNRLNIVQHRRITLFITFRFISYNYWEVKLLKCTIFSFSVLEVLDLLPLML